MSTYRPMSRSRHNDERLMAVGPIARAVWDYLCCNQQDHASGLYRLSIPATAEDTGWTVAQVEDALRELCFEKLIERDERTRLVWVRNMLHWSYPKPTSKHLSSVERHLDSMPRTPLVARLVAYYAERYGVTIAAEMQVDHAPNNGITAVVEIAEWDQSEIEKGGDGIFSESVSVSASVTESDSDRSRRAREVPTRERIAEQRATDIARLRERLTLTGEVPQPRARSQYLGNLPTRDEDLAKLLDAGFTPDEIVATAAWTGERVTAGDATRGLWSSAFFGRWHDSLRQREIPEKFRARATRGTVDPKTQNHNDDVPF